MAVVVDHPLVAERLTRLRDRTTKRAEFRRNLAELSNFLIYEALRDQPIVAIEIDTPLAPTSGVSIAEPPLVVPAWMATALNAPDVSARLQALETWAQQPRTGSVEPLLRAVDDPDEQVRAKAFALLDDDWARELAAEERDGKGGR